jgi:hypothetical protein
MRVNPGEWDALARERQDHLIDRKRLVESTTDANAQPVGRLIKGHDWKLQVVMFREQRQEEFSEMRRREMAIRTKRLDWPKKMSEQMRAAWAAGKFANRKQAYLKKTTARVARARRLRSDGWTYQQIGDAIGITSYTAMRWLGWTRPAKGESKRSFPVTFQGVAYPSLREAERQTGVPRHTIKRKASAG